MKNTKPKHRIETPLLKQFPDEPAIPLPKVEYSERDLSRDIHLIWAVVRKSGAYGLNVKEQLRKVVTRIYNTGYDNGLKHMDQMHQKVDELIKKDTDGKEGLPPLS